MDEYIEIPTLIRVYNSGRVERFIGTDVVPAGTDKDTGVTYKDLIIDTESSVVSRVFVPNIASLGHEHKLPIVVYYHGGGFCSFSPSSSAFTKYMVSVVAKANVIAVSVGYRLAPEHPLPAAYDDSFAALNWVFSNAVEEWIKKYGDLNRVFLAGDSAGGNIVHHMLLKAAGMNIKGAALMHPWFWSTEPVENEKRDNETSKIMKSLWKLACPETEGFEDPLINPIAVGAPSLEGLACEKLLVIVAEHDLLSYRGKEYHKAVKESGWRGKLEFFETEGEGHEFHLFNPSSEKAGALLQCLADFFNEN